MRLWEEISQCWRVAVFVVLIFGSNLMSLAQQVPEQDTQDFSLQVRQPSDVVKFLDVTTSASISSSSQTSTQLSTLNFSSNFTIDPITYTPTGTSATSLSSSLINSRLLTYNGNNNKNFPRGVTSSHNSNLCSYSCGQRNIPDYSQRRGSNSFHPLSNNLHSYL